MSVELSAWKRACRRWLWALFPLSLLLAALCYAPTLRTDEWYVGASCDLPVMQYQERAFTFESLRRGTLPLWNPRIYSGVPWSAGVRPAHYPLNFLGCWLPLRWEVKLTLVLHAALGLSGAWLLCRARRASPLAAWVGALTFGVSARYLAHAWAGHLDVCTTMAWCPWVVWSACRFAKRPTPSRLAVAGLCASLQLACGHIQVVYLTAWATAALLLCDSLPGRPRRGWLRLVGLAGATALLAAFQLMPSAASMQDSNRLDPGLDFAGGSAPRPAALFNLVLPHLFDSPRGEGGWSSWPVWEGSFYLGALPFTLALLGMTRSRRAARWLLPLGLLACLSVGQATPVFAAYLKVDPLLGRFRSPGRFMIAALLLLAPAAAQGVDVVRRSRVGRRRWAFMLLATTALLATSSFLLHFPRTRFFFLAFIDCFDPGRRAELHSPLDVARIVETGAWFANWAVGVAVVALLALRAPRRFLPAALVLICTVDAVVNAWPYNRCQPESVAMPVTASAELAGRLAGGVNRTRTPDRLINLGMLCGYDDVGGYSTFINKDYSNAACYNVGLMPGTFAVSFHDDPREKLVSMLSARVFVSEKAAEPGCTLLARTAGWSVFDNPDAYPRFYLAHAARLARQHDNSYPQAAREWRRLVDSPLLDPEVGPIPAEMAQPAHTSVAEVSQPVVGINSASCRTDSPRPGLLVMTDSPAPGWTAQVDGQPAALMRANGNLHRAVWVPAGQHTVSFAFFPDPLRRGLWISGLSWLALLLAVLRQKKKAAG